MLFILWARVFLSEVNVNPALPKGRDKLGKEGRGEIIQRVSLFYYFQTRGVSKYYPTG